MMQKEEQHIYIAIDLKSFYASVECVERQLDPLTTNLVVADPSRTEKTICLAVSPSLKAYGIPGRARLFEVVSKVKQVNRDRLYRAPGRIFTGESYFSDELAKHPELSLSYIVAPPRMAYYIEYSTRIYNIYLRYVAPEDIHVYSIDEVFMDVTHYLAAYKLTARQLASKIMEEVHECTGVTATAGIGTNMYLCKIAMDIVAKHVDPDASGARIGELDELSYRRQLWSHRPISDFWRVGPGYRKKLEAHGMYTMGDVARCSLGEQTDYYNAALLYKLFGVNAELLIDHAWGYEPTTIPQIKAYRPEVNSLCSGQVLKEPYTWEKARLVVTEMADLLALDLVDKGLVTDQLVLTVGFDIENLKNADMKKQYHGEITTDRYGRKVPKHAHGSVNLKKMTSASSVMISSILSLYDQIMNRELLVRRINITANHVVPEKEAQNESKYEQLDLFTDYCKKQLMQAEEEKNLEKEHRIQEAMLDVKKKYGKNAMMRGMNLIDGATARERNEQIGGHKA